MPPSTDLKQRDPRWGGRDVDDIVREAMPNELELREIMDTGEQSLTRARQVEPSVLTLHSTKDVAGNEDQVTRQQNHASATFNRNLNFYPSNQAPWQNARTSRPDWIDQCGVDLLNCSRRILGMRSVLASSKLLDFSLRLSSQ
jgi:hypothetical protein